MILWQWLLLGYLVGVACSIAFFSGLTKKVDDEWTRWILVFEASIFWPMVIGIFLFMSFIVWSMDVMNWLQVKLWILKIKIGKFLRKNTTS